MIVIAMMIPFGLASAEMFKCIEDGKPVYQDKPCRSSGSAIVVRPASGDVAASSQSTATNRPPTPQASVADRLKNEVDVMAHERKVREVEWAIRALERDIDGYRAAMDADLAALSARKRYATNNLAGATWEQSISTEMQAVTQQYGVQIQSARERIALLRQQAADLQRRGR